MLFSVFQVHSSCTQLAGVRISCRIPADSYPFVATSEEHEPTVVTTD
jgi:hypothetical protein